ncbi:hypothetical protein MGYG_00396 [Paecilomyces variotii No. 5]|uniref:Uncharacterized protein n=1 Tax=Byssochlamys spectabilis (strain No. 5 / NBRC 109023) TaxID=1356009 RepID=V5FV86_BYSSN|nr:hypothetical protein MGYG_00396 [Paecilomyces variotii No. 5]
MSEFSSPTSSIRVIGLREVWEIDGQRFTRRRGTQKWIACEPESHRLPPIDPESERLCLFLAHEDQGPEEPMHWSLYVAKENEPGMIYQVRGDAEYMTYTPSRQRVDITSLEGFSTLYQLATVTKEQASLIEEIAQNEPPPRAANRREAKENCQGWTVRVIAELVEGGIVPRRKLEMARTMMQPL